jgi:hypothetical protein
MMALVLMAANMPAMVCAVCSAFLACKERSQWVWFAALSVLAGFGGQVTLHAVQRIAAPMRAPRSKSLLAPGA